MTILREEEVIQSVIVRFKKKGQADASSPRPAKIVVSDTGKIDITSSENKFPPIHLKAANVIKPKKPQAKNATWIVLDIVQNVEAKFNYVNIQVNTPSEMVDVYDKLMIAWTPKKFECFADDESFSAPAPVHVPPPNKKKPVEPPAKGGRSARANISVDPEGSAHLGFNSDFSKPSSTQKKETTTTLKSMFDDYGIGNTSNAQPVQPVHTNPAKPLSTLKKLELRENGPLNTTKSLSNGISSSASFYGTSNNNSMHRPTPSSSMNRSGTKESLDRERKPHTNISCSLSQFSLSAVKEKPDEDLSMGPYDQYDTEKKEPPREKSLTSKAAVNLFDTQFKNKSNTSSKYSPAKPSSAFKAVFPDSNKSSYVKPETYGPWEYKKQPNIGNSCYMNSTMQILAACPIFVAHLSSAYESLLKLGKPNDTIRIFNGLMRWLTGLSGQKGEVKREMLKKMRAAVITLNPIFEENDGRAQQDAEECLTQLLGAISDECTGQGFRRRLSLGASPAKTPIKIPEPSEPVANEGTKRKMRAECDPVDLMEVKMKDVKRCGSCGDTNEKEAVEHRVHLGVEEEDEAVDSAWALKCVQQLLAAEAAQEEIIDDFKCDKCEEKSQAIGTKQFVRFGEYIIIVLKRFGLSASGRLRKLDTPIRVPLFLDTADFTEGGRTREKHDETIVINSLLSSKRPTKKKKEVVEVLSPIPLVDKTNEWLEGEDKENVETADTMADLLEDEDMGHVVDREMEEGRKEKKGKGKEEEHVIHIGSSQSDCEGEGKEEEEDDEETVVTAATADLDATVHDLFDETPPTVGKTEMRSSETRRRSDEGTNRRKDVPVAHPTTPTRKGVRQRALTVKEERRSTGSTRVSLTHSEPTRAEKRSRLEGRTDRTISSVASSPTHFDEVTIEESDDEEEKRDKEKEKKEKRDRQRNPSGEGGKKKNRPSWTVEKEEKKEEKEVGDDPFAFIDDEEATPAPVPKKRQRKFGPPARKPQPLADVNGLTTRDKREEESPVKGAAAGQRKRARRNENVSPSKSTMEQTGGGAQTTESDEEDEPMNSQSEDEKEEKEGEEEGDVEMRTEDEEEDEDEAEGSFKPEPVLDNVTRRSRAREERRNSRFAEEGRGKQDMERECHDGAMNEDVSIVDPNEEGLGSSEGGFIKTKEGPSVDEIVLDTPPNETEEEVTTARAEEEEKGVEGVEKSEKTATNGGNQKETSPPPLSPRPPTHRRRPLKIDEYAMQTLTVSPVKSDSDEKKEEDDDLLYDFEPEEETVETEADKAQRRLVEEKIEANKDKLRGKWRQLFVDTDVPPPRDYITFRPVDNRWMKGQCKLLDLTFLSERAKRELENVRAQSNLCKISSGPSNHHIVDIDGDGNCLFRALSWWVTGTQGNHSKMRHKIVEFMLNFPDEFGARMTGEEGQKYTMDSASRMFSGGEWGTQCEIYGAATLLGVDIYTFHEDRWKPYRPLFEWTRAGGYKVTRMTEVGERTRYGVYLTNATNAHYDVVMYMEPEAPESDTCYRLLGTIQHHGPSACSGHYVADVYDEEKAQWLHCDDDTISKKDTIEVLKNAMNHGYVLVYGKNDSEWKRKEKKMKEEKTGENVSVPSVPSSSGNVITDLLNSLG